MPLSRLLLLLMLLGPTWQGAATPAPLSHGAAEAAGDGFPTPAVDIATLLVDADDDTVPDRLGERARVRGVVTISPRTLSSAYFRAVVQDDSAGIVLFSHDLSMPLAPGELIEARGVVGQFQGAVQLQDVEVERIGRAPLPEPVPLSAGRAYSWAHMGQRVRVEGRSGGVTLNSFGTMQVTGDDGAELTLYFPESVVRDFDWEHYPHGTHVAATGVVSIYKRTWPYDGGFQVIVTDPGDLAVLAPPAPQWHGWALWTALPVAVLLVLALLVFLLAQRRQKTRRHELATLTALSTAIGVPDLDREQLARRACDILTAYGIAEAALVHVFDGRGGLQRLATSSADPARAINFDLGALLQASDPGAVASAPSQEHRRLIDQSLSAQGLTLLAVHPLPSLSGTQGFFAALSSRNRRPSAMQDRTLLSAVKLLALALENSEIRQRARAEQQELHQLAMTDELTELYNRRFLDEYLRVQLPLTKRRGGHMAFLAIDIDCFKPVNDTWGHEVGDRVLARVAAEIRHCTRSGDLAVRMGGEEFLIVLADADVDDATVFAERLRELIQDKRFEDVVPGTALQVTVSIGVAVFGVHGESAAALLRASDAAMYLSKRSGRNRTTLADDSRRDAPASA